MIVGVSGFKGSGKGVVASILEKNGFVRLSCASPLKDAVASLFSWPRELLEGDTEESRNWRNVEDRDWRCVAGSGIFSEDRGITPRLALQRIGTDLVRNMIDEDFWTIHLKKRIDECHRKYSNDHSYKGVVIDDVRFFTEYHVCDYNVCVRRDTYTDNEINAMHVSETEHLGFRFDTILNNNGTISDLEEQVAKKLLPQL